MTVILKCDRCGRINPHGGILIKATCIYEDDEQGEAMAADWRDIVLCPECADALHPTVHAINVGRRPWLQ